MRKRSPLLAAVAAVLSAAAIVLPAGGDEQPTDAEAITLARTAFPAAGTPIADGPTVPKSLPTRDPDDVVVGQAVLTGGTLTLTDGGEACLTVDGSSTCQPAEQAATYGLFLASVTCGPDATTVRGVVPHGVQSVAALGTDEPASDTPAPDGSVTLEFDGDDLDGIQLDTAAVAGPALDATCEAATAS